MADGIGCGLDTIQKDLWTPREFNSEQKREGELNKSTQSKNAVLSQQPLQNMHHTAADRHFLLLHATAQKVTHATTTQSEALGCFLIWLFFAAAHPISESVYSVPQSKFHG